MSFFFIKSNIFIFFVNIDLTMEFIFLFTHIDTHQEKHKFKPNRNNKT